MEDKVKDFDSKVKTEERSSQEEVKELDREVVSISIQKRALCAGGSGSFLGNRSEWPEKHHLRAMSR